jgi:hypothetical protein
MCGATSRSPNSSSTVGTVHLLADDIRRVVLEDLALRLHRLGERRVRDAAVREAATLALVQDLREPLDILRELPRQPRLADPRVPERRGQPWLLDAVLSLGKRVPGEFPGTDLGGKGMLTARVTRTSRA